MINTKTQKPLWIGGILAAVWLCGQSAGAAPSAASYLKKPREWFSSQEAKQVLENVLSWQDEYGSWPKAKPTTESRCTAPRAEVNGTFDNKATVDEIRLLAKAFQAVGDKRYADAFYKGLDLILQAQYPTGGWPQSYPPGAKYPRHITFNDSAMVRLMRLMQEIAGSPGYAFVDAPRRQAAAKAFDRGIDCILKCQITVDGKKTVWCAQHDELDFSPRPARSYELVSLSGGESAGILSLLMDLDNPSPQVIEAVTAGAEWYQRSGVEGIHIEEEGDRRIAVKDPQAPTLWARFYEIETNRPIFSDRDGVIKYDYNELGAERSSGYSWYNRNGEDVLEQYETWKVKWRDRLNGASASVPLVIVGDSTVCEYPSEEARRGWGQFIQEYFDEPVKVINLARSGRSTKTFIQEGIWKEALAQKPAYVLIQFGHSDSHAADKPESTNAATDFRDYLNQYVDESRAAGAVPVLITPMHRRKFKDGRLETVLVPYAQAMKDVAKAKGAALIDLHELSGKWFLELGDAGCRELANAPEDRTHFNEKGARAMAQLVMSQLPAAEPSLKQYLKADSRAAEEND